MQVVGKTLWIREEVLVPCVTCPACSIFLVDLSQMPIHVNYTNGKWNILFLEAVHQLEIRFLRIFIVAAPPVAECILWKDRGCTSQLIIIFQAAQIVGTVSKVIQILCVNVFSSFNPTVFCQQHGALIRDNSPTFHRKQTVLQWNLAICLIKCTGGSLQVMSGIAVMPCGLIDDFLISLLDTQVVSSKSASSVDKSCLVSLNDQLAVFLIYSVFRHIKGSIYNHLSLLVYKHTFFAVFHTNHARC